MEIYNSDGEDSEYETSSIIKHFKNKDNDSEF
jgi:hypothetical protein